MKKYLYSVVVGLVSVWGMTACGDTFTQVILPGQDAGDGLTIIYADGGAEDDRKPATQDSGKDAGQPVVDSGPTKECESGTIRCQDNYTEECSDGKWLSTNKVADQPATQCNQECTQAPGYYVARHDGYFPVVEASVKVNGEYRKLQFAREVSFGTYDQMVNYCRSTFNMGIVNPLSIRGDAESGPMESTCDPLIDNAAFWPRNGQYGDVTQFHISRDVSGLRPKETYVARGYEQGTTPQQVTITVADGPSTIVRYAVCGRWMD